MCSLGQQANWICWTETWGFGWTPSVGRSCASKDVLWPCSREGTRSHGQLHGPTPHAPPRKQHSESRRSVSKPVLPVHSSHHESRPAETVAMVWIHALLQEPREKTINKSSCNNNNTNNIAMYQDMLWYFTGFTYTVYQHVLFLKFTFKTVFVTRPHFQYNPSFFFLNIGFHDFTYYFHNKPEMVWGENVVVVFLLQKNQKQKLNIFYVVKKYEKCKNMEKCINKWNFLGFILRSFTNTVQHNPLFRLENLEQKEENVFYNLFILHQHKCDINNRNNKSFKTVHFYISISGYCEMLWMSYAQCL